MQNVSARRNRSRLAPDSDDDAAPVRARRQPDRTQLASRSLLRSDRPATRLRTIDDLDQRTTAARRARELIAAIESDLGGDLTAAERELAQRAALLGAVLADSEARWLDGNDADLSLYGALADRQRRILESLGLSRRAREVNPPGDGTRRALQIVEAVHGR